MNPINTTTPNRTVSRFENGLLTTVQWIRTHQEQFWSIFGTLMAAILLVVFMVHRRDTENENAWIQLGVAQGQLMQGQTDAAKKALDEWSVRFKGSTATSYAKFLRADLLYNTSDYAGAALIYGELVQTGRPADVRPLALSAQSSSEEMAGHLPQAQALAQEFVNRYPDHFLSAAMFISAARLTEATGNANAASALYDRFLILYPQSPWTLLAKSRQLALTGHAPSAPPVLPK